MRIEFMEPHRRLDSEVVESVLSLVIQDGLPKKELIDKWTTNELLMAYDWAIREHLRAGDNVIRRRPKPWFISAAQMISQFNLSSPMEQ